MTRFLKFLSSLTILGSLIWIPVPFIQTSEGSFVAFVAVVAPLLLCGGAYALSIVYHDSYGKTGVLGFRVLAVGLCGFAVFAMHDAFSLRGLLTGVLFSGIGFIGILAAEIGALVVGYASWQSETSKYLFIAVLPLALPLNIVFLNSVLPGSIFYFTGGLYGLAWTGVGAHLWRKSAS